MAPHASIVTYRRDAAVFGLLALLTGICMAAALQHPGYTDAYYYFNGGQRLVQGKGLTDTAIWTYIGAPAGLPIPSHLYWMPLASLVAAVGMALGGPTFDGAQIPFVLLYVGLALVGFALGAALGQSRRVAWLAGLLTAFSGLFMPYWTNTDTFALYGLVGSLCLVTMGLGRRSGRSGWFALSGAMAALAHLSRADGVLLLGVLLVVALWPGSTQTELTWPRRLRAALLGFLAYALVMTPWFIRNLNVIGAILPVGGMQTAWMLNYDEIVNYPPGADLGRFLDAGLSAILASRGQVLSPNLQIFVATEGMIVLTPLMLLGLWKRRREALLGGFWLYALGVHAVMILVFATLGWRGGLFHSTAALLPFWAALGVLGLDDVLGWIARRRRWNLWQAKVFFSTALVLWAVIFSVQSFTGKVSGWNAAGGYFKFVAARLPPDAIVMINDPSAMYYYTGLPGVVVPNSSPNVIPELAKRYGVTYVVVDHNPTVPFYELSTGTYMQPFLTPVYTDANVRIYRIEKAR